MNVSHQSFISIFSKSFMGLAVLALMASPAAAQKAAPRVPLAKPQAVPPPQRGPEITIKSKHGPWVVRCEKLTVRVPKKTKTRAKKGGKGNRGDRSAAQAPVTKTIEQCAMVQSLKPPKGRKVSMQIMFQKVKTPDGKRAMLMRMIVPLGVYLGDGIGLQIDGKAVGRFPYTRCYQQACTATIPVRPKLLTLLKKGKQANFFVYAFPGQGINMPMVLKDFTKAQGDL